MKISDEKRAALSVALEYCDEEDKSTEFTIAYLQNVADCDYETALSFLMEQGE